MAWNAQSLQAVFFTASASVENASSVFTRLTDSKPSNSQYNQLPSGLEQSNASGKLGEFGLTMQSQPGRLDVFLLPQEAVVPSATFPSEPPAILDVPAASQALADIVTKIDTVPANRLAVVFNLIRSADGPVGAAKQIINLTGIPIAFDDAVDLFFRVNRQSALRVDDESVLINRIMAWSVQNFQAINLTVGQSQPLPAAPVANLYAAALQIDLNTAQQPRNPFSDAQAKTIFSGLFEEGARLFETGALSVLAGD
ncbi:hypothetical protein LJR009_003587 [Bosea sp. LjRoot9]|uniref:hypothetical protein n=1 Tax=Bosea sp. LjRoot9 TaxID=3342341 RepID=UPI003ED06FDE